MRTAATLRRWSSAANFAIASARRACTGRATVSPCGPHMEKLRAALPPALRAVHAADSARLAQRVIEGLRPGDVVAVKGSLGSKMKVVVDAILAMGAVTSGSGRG